MNTPTFQDAYKALAAAKAAADKATKLGVATGDAGVINLAKENLGKATAAFCEVLERDTIQIEGKGRLLRTEYSLLQKLATDNKISLEMIIDGATVKNGRIVKASWDDLELKDISALAGLTSLTKLWLTNNQIKNISALKGLTALTELYLSGNQITDISALKGLTALTNLWLIDNQITDISALKDLVALTVLGLSGNQITDISALAGLTALTWLDLSGNQITDISTLKGLAALARLALSYNQITDVSVLAGLTSLTNLYLNKNPLIKNVTLETLLASFRSRGCMVEVDQ